MVWLTAEFRGCGSAVVPTVNVASVSGLPAAPLFSVISPAAVLVHLYYKHVVQDELALIVMDALPAGNDRF